MKFTGINNILVVCIGRLGDFIIISGFVKRLKEEYPDAEITVMAADFASEPAFIMPGADNVLLFPKKNIKGNLFPFLKRYFSVKWDMVINMNPAYSRRAAYVMKLSRGKHKVGFVNDRDSSFYTITAEKPHVEEHMLHIYKRLAGSIGIDFEPFTELVPNEGDIINARNIINRMNLAEKKFIAVHPGNFFKSRARWHEDGFISLSKMIADKYNMPQIYISGPGEEPKVQAVVDSIGINNAAMAPVMPIRTLAAFLQLSACFIGNSTGTLHLADACGVPTLSINDHYSYLCWRPLKPNSVALTSNQWRELTELKPETVFEGFERLVQINNIKV